MLKRAYIFMVPPAKCSETTINKIKVIKHQQGQFTKSDRNNQSNHRQGKTAERIQKVRQEQHTKGGHNNQLNLLKQISQTSLSKKLIKIQLTQLNNYVDHGRFNKTNLQLRIDRITEKFYKFESYHDELAMVQDDETYMNEFTEIQNAFYEIVSKVKELISGPHSGQSNQSETSDNTTSRNVKMPKTDLQKFDGNYEKWFSFKNIFKSMIDQRSDLNDTEKLIYLRSCLVGKAANKIGIYDDSPENYKKAWDFLQESYEYKRLIVTRHLRAICEIKKLKQETHDGLIALKDTVQQNVNALESLGASIGPEMLVFLVEQRLPDETAKKWELELSNDELPSFKKLCSFISQTVIRASKREVPEIEVEEEERQQPPTKRQKIKGKNGHAFMTNTVNNCVVCKKSPHQLFQCQEFLGKTIPQQNHFAQNVINDIIHFYISKKLKRRRIHLTINLQAITPYDYNQITPYCHLYCYVQTYDN
ncbi:uncharacterized protein [Prorops nasuta]|uniref:uncharacterized protein n=1 Tax=Prorops nasuta TaxID=863751 RepID=UPI0034CE1A96